MNIIIIINNIHHELPKIIHILCNIAHYFSYFFLVSIMLWYNKDSVT